MNKESFIKNISTRLNQLTTNENIGKWKFEGLTTVAFGTPGGSYQGVNGYVFSFENHKFILRAVNSMIAIESFNLQGQLYNADLSKHKVFSIENGYYIFKESYAMTVGYGRRTEEEIRSKFIELGYLDNIICKVNIEIPDWNYCIEKILDWAIIREKVKIIIKNGNTNDVHSIFENSEEKKERNPLNQILYGPPGTGKTYNTINRALEIIDPDIDDKDRAELKEIFEGYVNDGRIVFTTFHQSMSYEDFIEGIKPITENGQVTYDVQNGIFKRISKLAAFEFVDFENKESKDVIELTFSQLYDDYIDTIELKINAGEEIIVNGSTGNGLEIVEVTDKRNLKIKHKNSKVDIQYTVSKNRLSKLFETFDDLSLVKNIDKEFRNVIGGSNATAYWAILNQLINSKKEHLNSTPLDIKEYNYSEEEKISAVDKIDWMQVNKSKIEKAEPYVLIIDEINRGNVSAIFGELITLIEDSKRLGKAEALTVTLPYSKESFGVPPNLYIIGTMNTADRSVEALDTALRRRFIFEEMMPDLSLLNNKILKFDDDKELILSDLLKTINERIEVLLSRDHLIGHSYFLEVDSWEKLNETFYKNIIPLLQEYFYGDYGKIGLVLGSGFVEKTESKSDIFGDFTNDYDGYTEKTIFKIKPNNQDFNIQTAITELLKNGKKQS